MGQRKQSEKDKKKNEDQREEKETENSNNNSNESRVCVEGRRWSEGRKGSSQGALVKQQIESLCRSGEPGASERRDLVVAVVVLGVVCLLDALLSMS